MLNLIPEHTYDIHELWILIRKRNRWLVNLRYFAFLLLLLFAVTSKFVLQLGFTNGQFIALVILAFVILAYNILLYYVSDSAIVKDEPSGINPIVISFIQIQLDLLILSLIVYQTGGIESPFYIFYIFHMIIGSMILPGYVIYTIAGVIVITFYLLSLGEYFGIITHFGINGLLDMPIYDNIEYVLIFATAFGVMMIVSVFLANSITTALYRREQDLKITLDKLNNAEKIKQKYIMGVVHEIKSPIAAVQSYLDLILGKYTGPVPEGIEDKLGKARLRSDEAIQIINDVLYISRLKLEGEIEKSDIDIYEVLNKIVLKREIQAKSKKINLKFIDKREKKNFTSGDANLLDLAFSNLIGNAIKYTGDNGIVEIVLYNENELTKIEVCDNGIGIPPEDKSKIFSEFYRASNAKHKIYDGTGTGLTVVKQIIEQHRGKIYFESPSRLAGEKGTGTSFYVEL